MNEGGAAGLTRREQAVLLLVSAGLSNRGIARHLGISEKTVKNHLSAIYPKIGAADRTQAALYAVQDARPEPPVTPGRTPALAPEALAHLTSRETDVLLLVSAGLSNRGIARHLGISEKTVKNHLSAIYPKIGAADRTQAALYAVGVR
ncbi:response regulator transcription factor [Actinacidiphila acididurans]|uniref:response regulator transcription factor n=1 Tax=Actinacidiphila acididurans TaxID=2784346 RepID=UPI0027DE972A|nr:LuxR C-terminal-related transcriptional regulator [Actinacidiphila acididurans]